ncbi:MAG: tetratricopeptide repeat protein [Myxococcales bacterium FL481]|nr:MAG: tetratricopeptide repeat protein [Myxococcales bacterium FL481]
MLRNMVAARATDPFPRYGLAMELRKRGEYEEAHQVFAALLEDHASYLPTYLMAGNLMAERGDPSGAREVYDRGIVVARDAGDGHTQSELEAARAELD